MGRIACAHPGKIGDALYALPAARALAERHGAQVDFYTSEYCRPMLRLLEAQSFVDRAVVAEGYKLRDFGCGAQPWSVPVPRGYDAVYQLGFRSTPNCYLPDWISQSVRLPVGLPIQYDYEDRETLAEPYIVIAPRGGTSYAGLFRELAETCPMVVVEVGARGEGTGSSRSMDLTGEDMVDVLPWLARSRGFVGLMSSSLALANGFPIPRVAPHDGRHWDMRHVARSPLNHYPVNPTAAEVLRLLGVSFSYCRTLRTEDYDVLHEARHVRSIRDIVQAGRFEHAHRAWEYGLVLHALREYGCRTVLDVGGGGSVFAPAAAWLGMDVTQVDPGDCSRWVAEQSRRIGRELRYVQQNFADYAGEDLYDAVVSVSVLEHVPDDAAFFRRMANRVRPGGVLVITVDYWPDGAQKCGGHLRTYNAERLKMLAESVEGFSTAGSLEYGACKPDVNGYSFASLVLRRD